MLKVKNQPNMNNLVIQATNTTPAVEFRKEGKLSIEGRSLPENTMNFYQPLIEWAAQFKSSDVKLDINLEYLNSGSIKKLLELLKVFDANDLIKTFYVDWHYDKDDEDILENAGIFEEILKKARFRYHELSFAASLALERQDKEF
jgi:hypothetical protein